MIIGVTGGIGSGKSTVTEYLMNRGYPVVDADDIARQIVKKGTPTLAALVEALGEEILLSDGSLDRAKTADIVFSDRDKKDAMDAIMWKEIGRVTNEEVKDLTEEGYDVIFFDAPLLFEAGLQDLCDRVWMVYADEDIRIERVVERDDTTPDQVRARMSMQMSDQEKMDLADEVLDNNDTPQELIRQVDELLEQL